MKWIVFLVSFVPALPLFAEIPNRLPHQGRIAVDGSNFDGAGQFKFLLYSDNDGGPATALWSNAGISPADLTEPASAVSLPVTKGLYSVFLGDTGVPNMAALPASIEPPDGLFLYLRIWFDDGVNGFQQLAPDQEIAPAAFALHARSVAAGGVTADAIADGAITSAKLADSAVTNSKLADASVSAAKMEAGAAGANIDATGSLGLGLDGSTQTAAIQIDGEVMAITPTLLAEVVDGQGGFNALNGASSVFVSGNTAFVASSIDDSLTLIDVTDPAAPALLAEIRDSQGGFNALGGANSVFVSGNTAFVASRLDSSLTLIDVTDPAAPALLSEVVDGQGGFDALNGANSVFVSGTTAFVTSSSNHSLTIIDVTVPAAPALLAEIVDGQGGFNALNGANSVFVSGSTAFVASFFDNALTLIDVADPAAPGLLAQVVDGQGGFNALKGPRSVFISGNTAYVASGMDDFASSLTLIDVSNPNAPALLAEIIDGQGGFNRFEFPSSIFVSGNTAFVTTSGDSSLMLIDVTSPSAPALLAEVVHGRGGFDTLRGARSVFVSGTTAFVASEFSSSLTILKTPTSKIDLVAANRVGIGTGTPQAMLHVEGGALITGRLSATSASFEEIVGDIRTDGGLNVMQAASFGASIGVDGSANLTGDVSADGSVVAAAHEFPAPRTFVYNLPGSGLEVRDEGETYARSTAGFITLGAGTSTLSLFGDVRLPQGATVTGIKLLYQDNSAAGSFTNLDGRLRRRAFESTGNENMAVLQDASPPSSPSATMRTLEDAAPVPTRATIDNEAFQYWVYIDVSTDNPGDSNLRIYGIRLTYTLEALQP